MNGKTEAGKARSAALAALSHEEREFLDPCDYMNEVWNEREAVPEMQRGCAHGDLHGRNVLVGLIDGQAKWPAVFDYEDMSCNNYLAWDFVKLEMELKVRALCHVLQGEERDYIKELYRFEVELAEETEARNNAQVWNRDENLGGGERALRGILLGLRRMAKKCLETHRGRNRRWLDEYYFLLACYGVYAGRFTTYQWRQWLASFVCAGVAAYRCVWRHRIGEKEKRQAGNEAKVRVDKGDPSPPPWLHEMSYQGRLAFASAFARSRKPDFVAEAVELLQELRQDYRWVAEIGHELAFALIERSTLDQANRERHRAEAERLLEGLEDQFRGCNDELLGRVGRLWKDRADEVADRPDDTASNKARAGEYYAQARIAYEKAYAISGNYYPGINVASLYWMLGDRNKARALARDLLTSLDEKPKPPPGDEEEMWILATRGEANLLLGDMDAARRFYQESSKHSRCTAHARDSMKRQANRILKTMRKRGLKPGCLDPLFDVPAAPLESGAHPSPQQDAAPRERGSRLPRQRAPLVARRKGGTATGRPSPVRSRASKKSTS